MAPAAMRIAIMSPHLALVVDRGSPRLFHIGA